MTIKGAAKLSLELSIRTAPTPERVVDRPIDRRPNRNRQTMNSLDELQLTVGRIEGSHQAAPFTGMSARRQAARA
jgi:hypothetical protein